MGMLLVAVLVAAAWVVTGGPSLSRYRLGRVVSHSHAPLEPGPSGPRSQPKGGARSRDREPLGGLVPSVLDVLAACLCSGAPLEHALLAVARAFGGDVERLLGGVARQAALGAPAETAWAAALADPQWAGVARSIVRAHYSGAPLADVLNRAADDRRRELRVRAEGAASRAAVRAVLPLGICFLPAFVLVGVVPVVAGFAGTLWG